MLPPPPPPQLPPQLPLPLGVRSRALEQLPAAELVVDTNKAADFD